ncbi:MAG: MG2 domain-containing protein [Candidatus Caenarcaniphilales bacterium]|nr:MG2 domain-containing protein [Candidatus Caenarcaniphilales bacterium]
MSKSQLNWLLIFSFFFAIAAGAVILEKPKGNLAGAILVEEGKFGLSKKALAAGQVYALVSGPYNQSGIEPSERGVWVGQDGKFTIRNLITGEYSLRLKAKGYTTINQYGLLVEEGKTKQLEPVSMEVLEPSLYIASNTRVFTTKEQPRFWVNLNGCEELKVKIYPVNLSARLKRLSSQSEDLQFGFNLDLYKNYALKSTNPPSFAQKPLLELTRKVELDYNDSANVQFKLDKSLPAGEYYAVGVGNNWRGQTQWNIWWFSVSDLGVIVKQAPEKVIVRAIDLNTLKPLSGASVELIQRDSSTKIATLMTGSDGMSELTVPRQLSNRQTYIVVATQGENRAYSHIPIASNESDHYQVYFYTERPIYRLGQTIFFKGVVRKLESNGLVNEPNTSFSLSVEDPDGNVLKKEDIITNANGTFHGSFQLPEGGKTGGYQVMIVDPDQVYHFESIEVGQYRKPEFKVDLKPTQEMVIGGDLAKMRLQASYFFGAPVSNARVKYTIYYKPDWETQYKLAERSRDEAYYDDWEEEEGQGYDSGYAGDYLLEGYAQTDSNGEAQIEFKTKPIRFDPNLPYDQSYLDQIYRVEAEVTDLTRMTVSGEGESQVKAGSFALLLDPSREIYRAGEKASFDVQALGYDTKPIADQNIKLTLVHWIWQEKNNTYKFERIAEANAQKTDLKGKARFTLEIPTNAGSGDYSVLVESEDKANHKIHHLSSIWIESPTKPFALEEKEADRQPLKIRLDKKVYQPGDFAQVVISAPTTGQEHYQALVAVEGTKLHRYRLITLDSTAKLIEIPITQELAPNAYITVTYVAPKHIVYNQSKLLKVSPSQKFLDLKIHTSKAKYKPGEKIDYIISAHHTDGKPAEGVEISLGIVDESIYAIRGETAEDIRKFFYQRRPNWVTTTTSFPEEYSGGPDKIEPRLRQDFRDTAAWFPVLKTDAQGTAKASFTLPDNLTSWRATARGIGIDQSVGQSTYNVLAVQDLIVRLGLPRFFVQGDQAELRAVVSNYTDREQEVVLDMESSDQFDFGKDIASNPKLKIKPDGSESHTWSFKVTGSGNASFKVKAYGTNTSDALLQKMNVLPLGVRDFRSESGILESDSVSKTFNLELPKGSRIDSASYELRLAGSVLGTVIGSLDSLIDYPHGCTEQTMSRLYPSLIVKKLERELNIKLTPDLLKKLVRSQKEAFAILNNNQNDDGGWGWWNGDQSVPFLTAYVMEGLKLLSENGFRIEPEITDRGRAWLKNNLSDLLKQVNDQSTVFRWNQLQTSLTDIAYIYYALSLYEKPDSSRNLDMLIENKLNFMPPEALSYLILARHPSSSKLALRLKALAKENPQTIDWEHNDELSKQLGLKDHYPDYDYRYSSTETTTLAFRALLKAFPEEVESQKKVLDWISIQRDESAWQNTKTTALVLRTLMDYELMPAQHDLEADFVAKVSGFDDIGIKYDDQNRYDPERVWQKKLSAESPRETTLTKSGSGKLSYQSLLTFFHALKPGESLAQKAIPEGLSIKREFFNLKPVAVPQANGKIKLNQVPLIKPKAGEIMLMKVMVESPIQLPFIMLSVPLPSGGEVLDQDPRESMIADDPYESEWGSWWWTHRDLLDDKVVYFVRDLPAGKSVFTSLIRMEHPGSFHLLPVELSGMYSPRIKAYSGLSTLKVYP